MLPNPLHAAIVHFPVVLAVLLPLVAVSALIAIRRGAQPLTAWGITAAVAAALVLASWVSLETGEAEEEKVEDVVSEGVIGRHEEAAQLFTIVAGGVLLLTVAGLARGRIGSGMRAVATIGTLGVVAAGVNVGHSGGQLVYRYGAASAYATGPGGAGRVTGAEQEGGASARTETRGDNDDDDR